MSVWWWICPGCGRFREINGPRKGPCEHRGCSSRPEPAQDNRLKTV